MIDYSNIEPESRGEVLDDLGAVSKHEELKRIEPYARKFGLMKEFEQVRRRIITQNAVNSSLCAERGQLHADATNATQRKYRTPLIGPEFGYKWDAGNQFNVPSTAQAKKMVAKAERIAPLPSPLTYASFANWCDRTGAMGLTLHDIYDINRSKK